MRAGSAALYLAVDSHWPSSSLDNGEELHADGLRWCPGATAKAQGEWSLHTRCSAALWTRSELPRGSVSDRRHERGSLVNRTGELTHLPSAKGRS